MTDQTITIVPAAAGFEALFLTPEDMKIPRQFLRHAVVAWRMHQMEIDGETHASAWPVCITVNGDNYDFISGPDGSLEHATGFTCGDNLKEALAYALDQEAMGQRQRLHSEPKAGSA